MSAVPRGRAVRPAATSARETFTNTVERNFSTYLTIRESRRAGSRRLADWPARHVARVTLIV